MRREDLTVSARGPLNRRFAVYADATLAVPASLSGWTGLAQVRTSWRSAQVLATLGVVVEASAVRVTASADETARWPLEWPGLAAAWDLVLAEPDGTKHPPLVGGWLTVDPYVSRP